MSCHGRRCPTKGDALVALFEIGADTTSLKVLRDDESSFRRPRPGLRRCVQLTQLIRASTAFSFEEAEQKKLAGDLPEDYETTILAPFVDSLSQETGCALQYFLHQHAAPQGALRDAGRRHGYAAGPEGTGRTDRTWFCVDGGQPV